MSHVSIHIPLSTRCLPVLNKQKCVRNTMPLDIQRMASVVSMLKQQSVILTCVSLECFSFGRKLSQT